MKTGTVPQNKRKIIIVCIIILAFFSGLFAVLFTELFGAPVFIKLPMMNLATIYLIFLAYQTQHVRLIVSQQLTKYRTCFII